MAGADYPVRRRIRWIIQGDEYRPLNPGPLHHERQGMRMHAKHLMPSGGVQRYGIGHEPHREPGVVDLQFGTDNLHPEPAKP